MSTFQQLVPPRPWVVDFPGACLRYSQSFFGAPAMHRSARRAWDALPEKYGPGVPLPDVPYQPELPPGTELGEES